MSRSLVRRRAVPGLALLALSALAIAAAGCGGARPHAAPPGPPGAGKGTGQPAQGSVAPGGARSHPGYDAPPPSLRGLDTSALRGRRIVLDPGHGGRFPGSIGPTGLTEAEVNLGVALHLWGLLTDAGAEVLLTRTTDRDLTTPADSSLRADLAARVDEARAFDPDVFVSIHHNADLSQRHDLNETQTYYRLADPLASYALARAVHARLVSGLGVGADRLMPGNYFVVRNAPCPSMLGESSYLTNPDVESRLALAARQRLEAVSYFLGLLDYFRTGVPRLASLGALPGPAGAGGDSADAHERPWITARTDRAPGSPRLLLDGTLVDTTQVERAPAPPSATGAEAWTLRFRPAEPLADGPHRVEWTVQSASGAWSATRADSFTVRLAPARVVFEIAPGSGHARAGQLAGLTLALRDRHGRPLGSPVEAAFTPTVGARMVDTLSAQAHSRPVPGEARAYARLTGGSVAEFAYTISRPALPRGWIAGKGRVTLAPEGRRGARVRSGFVRAATAAGDLPVAGALVRGPSPADTARTNADGFYALAGESLTVEAPGYVTTGPAGKGDDLALAAIGQGALLGRRIVLDAAGGGADLLAAAAAARDTAAAPDSTAGPVLPPAEQARADSLVRARVLEADANLRVARALGEYLAAAGAQVLLTRDAPDSLSTLARLRAAEGFGADRLLTISHRAPPGVATVGHYFASAPGKALALRLADRLGGRGLVAPPTVFATPGYLVQQASAIAVAVDLPAAGTLDAEPTRAAARLREEAYALYLGLLEDLGGAPASFLPLAVKVTESDAPEGGVPVTLDHRWTLFTGPDGVARFDGLPPHALLTVEAGGRGPGLLPAPAVTRVTLPRPGGVTLALPSAR